MPTFTGVLPSHLLPSHPLSELVKYTVVNTDAHTEPGSHWVTVLDTRPSSGYYFDTYDLLPLVPAI